MAMTRPNVELHIEELVLLGFAPGDRHTITRAFEAELGRLLARDGLPGSSVRSTSIGSLDGGSFEADHSISSGVLGTRIGGAVYRSLGLRE